MSSTLEFLTVSKRYPGGGRPAVHGVDLRVDEGEILALVGQSGSGKTTLLRLASGLEVPDSGAVLIGGEVVAGDSVWQPPERRGIGFVFQDGALFPHMTVAENIRYGLNKQPRAQSDDTVNRMLTLVGMQDFADRYPHELSGGERQRLAVVRALAPEPKVVLMDEPFSNLDQALRRSLRDEIRRILLQLGTTVILVSHDTDDALAIGNRVAILNQGRIEQLGTPEHVYHRPANGYCARLFGPANEVRLQDGATRWVRPDDMRLIDHESERAIEVTIRQVWDAGRHFEVLVAPARQDDDRPESPGWVVYSAKRIRVDGSRMWAEISFPADAT